MVKHASWLLVGFLLVGCSRKIPMPNDDTVRQLTTAPHGHILTNANVWSPDSQRIVYDVRSDAAGSLFDGDRIEIVDVGTGTVTVLYQAQAAAKCGVVTYAPHTQQVAFIIGPEHPTPDFTYGPARRLGLLVDEERPGIGVPLDARQLMPPFTPGALRGGSHVHIYNPAGTHISFTYEDHVLSGHDTEDATREMNLRTIGVSVLGQPVTVPATHPRNRSGLAFSVLVVDVTAQPRLGSDDISKAVEEGWIGTSGYVRVDGTRQRHALAFQGHVRTATGTSITEVFVVDLPDSLTTPGTGPLAGTITHRPRPPRGTQQRRLTYTADRKHPGLAGPRHWLRSSPDGSQIACLMRDDAGIVQLWTVATADGTLRQVTQNAHAIASAFTWSPDGRFIAHVLNRQVCRTNMATGETTPLTSMFPEATAPRPEACVYSPDGQHIAFVRPMPSPEGMFNQVFVCKAAQP